MVVTNWLDWCTREAEPDLKEKKGENLAGDEGATGEGCVGCAAAAEGKCGTGEGDNGRTWGPGTVAKDYGIWGKAHGTHPA